MPELKPQPSRRRIAALTVLWSTWTTLVGVVGPRWIALAYETATDQRSHLYRADQMDSIAVFLGVLMVVAWLAALIVPMIWLCRRYAQWRKWMAVIPPVAAVAGGVIALFSMGLEEFLSFFA